RPDAAADRPVQPAMHLKRATLWGGNLSMLTSLLGTPYFPDIAGGVLFLEDVHEHPYRIERLLTQLLHAGVLARQKAVLLGQFTDFKLTPHDKGYRLQSVVDWLRTQIKAPVLTHLPFGHVATKVLLPVGATVSLSVQERDALGIPVVDYGNNIRQVAFDEGVKNAFDIPGFVPAYIRPLFCAGKGPFRWVALSGDPQDIDKTDARIKALFPENRHLHRWLDMARAP
ncbi:hypothetical protein ET532_023255, partial [Verminephrobacter sp. Larva24]